MQEELINLKRNQVWFLVERPTQNVIGTKWVFRNKQDEHGVVTRNKARLVAKAYSQVEGLDFDKTFAPIARLESIRMWLAYATHHDFKLDQMDVEHQECLLEWTYERGSLCGTTSGFKDKEYPNHVYRLH
jgi:hypothetical protein